MKTKITTFLHTKDCKCLWIGINRKEKKKVFEIKGRDVFELAKKVNGLMKCLLLFILLILPVKTIAEPGYTTEQVKREYLPHWHIEYINNDTNNEYWHLSSKIIDAKIVITINKKRDIVTEIKYGYYCYNSGKRIYELMEKRLRKFDNYWYIQQPCMKENCDGELILISIEIYNNHYVIQRRLWKPGQ